MPAASPEEAAEIHRAGVARAIACVVRAHVVAGGGYLAPTQPRAIALNDGDSVRLRGPAALSLSVARQFMVHEGADGWSARVSAYFYVLAQEDDKELLAFHWHPSGVSSIQTPHLHVGAEIRIGERWLPKIHLPTGSVGLEDVLALAIEEMGVEPIRDDWRLVLDQTRDS